MAGVEALGVDPARLEVKLGQMVSLVDGDEAVKMGKRAGNAIDLDTVIADIGPDATRILSLMSSLDQAATFDLAAVREQSVGEPGLLRPDGQRPHRRRRPQGGRAGRGAGARWPRSTCPCSPTPASSRCSAASRSCPRWWPTPPSTGPRPR